MGYDRKSNYVIVLENNDTYIPIIKEAANELGLCAIVIKNYKDCKKRYLEDDYCAAIIDIDVPEHSGTKERDSWGYDLARTLLRSSQIPIALYTGYEDIIDRQILRAIEDWRITHILKDAYRSKLSEIRQFLELR